MDNYLSTHVLNMQYNGDESLLVILFKDIIPKDIVENILQNELIKIKKRIEMLNSRPQKH